jgi:enoyl-CoA hydratase/carnithine racemase
LKLIETILIETTREGRVLRIALNRPDKRNALNLALCEQLRDALDRAGDDPSVGAIVLTGNGPVFCAGMDLRDALEADPFRLAESHSRLFSIIQRLRKPLIAAVHGAALAGGVGLAANAHIVVARPDTRFALTEIRIGLWPVLIFRAFALAAGERRATELSLTGRDFTVAEAHQYGLVTEIDDDPLQRAAEIAAQVGSYSPLAISAGLGYVQQIRGRDWEEASRIGRDVRDRLLKSDAYKEGVSAFLRR